MRLVYLANNRIPSEKANSLQIMQMCRAFLKQGAEVTLLVPRRMQPRVMRGVSDPFAYYGIAERFPIERVPCLDALEVAPARLQHPAFALQSATFAASLAANLASRPADVYYSRDPLSTVMLALMPASIRRGAVYEAHTFPGPGPRRDLHLWAIRRIGKLVCITQGLADEYAARGVETSRLLVAPDAVELERFTAMPAKEEARASLGIPLDRKVACYTGHLYRWKGAHTLALASGLLPHEYLVYLVGGTEEDQESLRRFVAERGLSRATLAGHLSPKQVVSYLAAADVLVLPNSGADLRSSRYTSPMKLFEYMAARRPIVASDLPALREVLCHEENAILVRPDDPAALAEGIARAGSDAALSARLAESAWRDVQGFSWNARARHILDFIGG